MPATSFQDFSPSWFGAPLAFYDGGSLLGYSGAWPALHPDALYLNPVYWPSNFSHAPVTPGWERTSFGFGAHTSESPRVRIVVARIESMNRGR
jgi:hypothetical protein